MTRSSWLLLAATGLALGACGRVGPLEQPAPLYGAKAKSDYQARKAAEAAAQAQNEADQPEPLAPDTPGVTQANPPMDTLRDQPPPGSRPQPNSPAPPGVLPDPFNRPQ
jgi:hypothetical protein